MSLIVFFLVLLIDLIVLFQQIFALSTVLSAKSFQFQLNKLFPNEREREKKLYNFFLSHTCEPIWKFTPFPSIRNGL